MVLYWFGFTSQPSIYLGFGCSFTGAEQRVQRGGAWGASLGASAAPRSERVGSGSLPLALPLPLGPACASAGASAWPMLLVVEDGPLPALVVTAARWFFLYPLWSER